MGFWIFCEIQSFWRCSDLRFPVAGRGTGHHSQVDGPQPWLFQCKILNAMYVLCKAGEKGKKPDGEEALIARRILRCLLEVGKMSLNRGAAYLCTFPTSPRIRDVTAAAEPKEHEDWVRKRKREMCCKSASTFPLYCSVFAFSSGSGCSFEEVVLCCRLIPRWSPDI